MLWVDEDCHSHTIEDMKTEKDVSGADNQLRRRAEDKLKAVVIEQHPPVSGPDMKRLAHELEVYQLELEMQNDELRESYNAVEKGLAPYSELYDSAPGGYFTLDRQSNVCQANLAGASLLGVARSKLVQRRFGLYVLPESRPIFNAFLDRVFESHRKQTCEVVLQPENSATLHVRIDGDTSRNGECHIVVMDISAHKKAEMEIIQLNSELERRVSERTEQLEAANRELETFCYSVAHDLRAPLRHINGYVGMLASRCRENLNDQGMHYLDTIVDSSRQMGVLIDDLLQFSRTARPDMCLESLDMNQVLADALNSLKDGNRDRTIEWAISEFPAVRGDYVLLRQVWVNLLANAVKYTQPKETARIEISSREENEEIIFVVKDNGVGFDMQYVGKLFGIFQRLHTQEEFEGFGIGLTIVQRIIERHGGRVWAEAELNEGATFSFTLPRSMESNHA